MVITSGPEFYLFNKYLIINLNYKTETQMKAMPVYSSRYPTDEWESLSNKNIPKIKYLRNKRAGTLPKLYCFWQSFLVIFSRFRCKQQSQLITSGNVNTFISMFHNIISNPY